MSPATTAVVVATEGRVLQLAWAALATARAQLLTTPMHCDDCLGDAREQFVCFHCLGTRKDAKHTYSHVFVAAQHAEWRMSTHMTSWRTSGTVSVWFALHGIRVSFSLAVGRGRNWLAEGAAGWPRAQLVGRGFHWCVCAG